MIIIVAVAGGGEVVLQLTFHDFVEEAFVVEVHFGDICQKEVGRTICKEKKGGKVNKLQHFE